MTMSLEPLVFRRVPRVFVAPDVPRKTEIVETTGVEILEVDEAVRTTPPANQQELGEKPVPFASTLRHI